MLQSLQTEIKNSSATLFQFLLGFYIVTTNELYRKRHKLSIPFRMLPAARYTSELVALIFQFLLGCYVKYVIDADNIYEINFQFLFGCYRR